MAQYQNLTGTTSKTFKIGKFGTTLSIGTLSLYNTSVQYLQSDTALLTNKVLLDATGNTYIDSSNYTGNANTANKLKKAINFQITGGATSDSVNSDLSQNVTLTISSLDATKLNGNIAWANVSSLAGTIENSFALGNHNHNSLYAPINASLNFVGNVTGSGAMNSNITLNIADGAVTNEKVVSIVPSKIVGAKGNTTIGSSTNVINLYGKSNTSGEADYAKNLKSSADHAIVIQTANTTSFLSPGSSGELLQTTGAGNNPSWVSPSSLTVSHASTAGALSNSVNAGSENLPVYFKNGLPVQTSTTLNVSITGNASTATKANSATYITNAKGTASYTYSTIEDLISNTARKVQVGASGTQYSASNNIITIPTYTEGATKVEESSINGQVKINGVDTVVYNDADLKSRVSTNATNITTVSNNLTSHVTNVSNPHSVTKAQVGLGSVVNKPQTSTATDISGATSTGTTASYYTRAYDVKTYLENTLKSDLTLGGNVNVNGNLTVKGSTITLDAQNLAISDQLLELYKRDNGTVPLNGYAGIYVNNYSGEDNNKIEGLFVDSSVNAYVGTATISGNTLSNASMKKLATESYVTTQLSNNEEVEILDIDIAENSTASTLVKRTSGGLINANTPTNASASTSVINLDYLGKIDKVLTPNANNAVDIGTATKAYKTVYTNQVQSANSSTLTLSGSSGIVINNNVSPNATNTLNFGSTDKQWNNIYGKVLYENGTALSAIYQPKGEYLTAADISNKLDKSTSASRVYGTTSSGDQTMYSLTQNKTGNTLVYRDASGNFAANVITATLSGNASTATKAERDSEGNIISSTYFKNTGGILANVSTASSNKNFSINSYTYAGSVNNVIDYVATSTSNSLHIGGNSADKDDRGVQKLEFTVTDGQESTSKTPIITLTKGNIDIYDNTNISIGSNVNIGSSTNKVNSIYTNNLYLNGKDVSNFYNSLQDTTGTVQTGTHNSTTVISEITASNGTLQYKKVKLPAESNNRVTQTLVSDNKDYNLLFTSASTTTAQASTQFNTGIKVNPNTGTIKATVFSGRATSAENIYVDSSTSIAASTIKSAIDKVEGATSFPDANTIVYRNADKSTSITKLYTNEIHPITTKDTLTIEGKASQAGDADIAKAVYNNGASTNALTFSTEAAYTNSDANILVQAPSTNVVKHSTIKSLIDTVNVAYQNGTYADMTVGEATHASTATTATKADSVKHEAALSGVSYRLALSQSDAAGYYAPRISDISVKGNVITATLSGNATSASTATNISGGAVNSLVYQTTTGVTGFISYPTDVSTTNEYILTAKKVNTSNTISWIKSPYVKKSGDTITGKLTVQSGDPSGCLQLGADVSSNTLTAGTRKLARLTFPTKEYGTTKTCSIMSCDNMNDYNYVEFGGHIGDATNTAPDYMCFNVDKTHNSLSPTTKECVMAISPTSLKLFSGALDAGQITSFDSISSKWVFNNANTFKNSGFTYTLPNKTGTLALADDVPTKVSQLENDSGFTSNKGTITEIKVNGVSKGTSGSVDLTNMVTYKSSQTVNVAGTNKVTYTYNQPSTDGNMATSIGSAFFPEGIIMGGTAASAGLVTRGICGVNSPDANTGACSKENLYINYDGSNIYQSNRQLVLQAGSAGTHYGHNLYQFAAARGDAVKEYCDHTYAAKTHTHNYAASDTAGGPANSVKNALTIGTKSYNGSAATSISTQDVIGANKITIGGKTYDGSAAISVSTQDVIGENKITFGTKEYDGSKPVTFETTDLGIEDIGSAELNTIWNEVFA